MNYCYYDCTEDMKYDDHCDQECYVESCAYDNGTCAYLEPYIYNGAGDCCDDQGKCPWELIGNGQCDWDCYVQECNYDGWECEEACATFCDPGAHMDDMCQIRCYN